MDNKETLQSYNTRLISNGDRLSRILTTINNLPDANNGSTGATTKLYLIKNGVEQTDVTGGHTYVRADADGIYAEIQGDGYIDLIARLWSRTVWEPVNKFDFNKYNKIHIELEYPKQAPDGDKLTSGAIDIVLPDTSQDINIKFQNYALPRTIISTDIITSSSEPETFQLQCINTTPNTDDYLTYPVRIYNIWFEGQASSEDLTEELNDYNTKLATQKTSIQDIMTALKTKGTQTITLQDKTVEITENGTTNIVADEGYDGLNNVEVTTNISGGEEPTVYFKVYEWDETGYPLVVEAKGRNTIGSYMFAAQSSGSLGAFCKMTKFIVNDMVTQINNYAFNYCIKLESVEISKTSQLEKIATSSFQYCQSLKNIKLPDTLTTIGTGAFNHCYALTQISMRNVNNLGSVDNTTYFYKCTSLKAVWIGNGITNMAGYTFQGCTALLKIFIDKPRATVETFVGYPRLFAYQGNSAVEVICNDDEGFMTKEEFDAIDWSTYEG